MTAPAAALAAFQPELPRERRLYGSAGADGEELRDGLTEVSVLLNEMYSSGVVSFDTVF